MYVGEWACACVCFAAIYPCPWWQNVRQRGKRENLSPVTGGMLITLVQETDTNAKKCTGVGAYIRGQVTQKTQWECTWTLKMGTSWQFGNCKSLMELLIYLKSAVLSFFIEGVILGSVFLQSLRLRGRQCQIRIRVKLIISSSHTQVHVVMFLSCAQLFLFPQVRVKGLRPILWGIKEISHRW